MTGSSGVLHAIVPAGLPGSRRHRDAAGRCPGADGSLGRTGRAGSVRPAERTGRGSSPRSIGSGPPGRTGKPGGSPGSATMSSVGLAHRVSRGPVASPPSFRRRHRRGSRRCPPPAGRRAARPRPDRSSPGPASRPVRPAERPMRAGRPGLAGRDRRRTRPTAGRMEPVPTGRFGDGDRDNRPADVLRRVRSWRAAREDRPA
jgi:hypothetical protein